MPQQKSWLKLEICILFKNASLRNDQIPSLFEKDSYNILVTGKYLNIMKVCSGLEQHPLHK